MYIFLKFITLFEHLYDIVLGSLCFAADL